MLFKIVIFPRESKLKEYPHNLLFQSQNMESVGSNETVRSIQCIGMIYESEIAAFDLSGYIPAGKATILPLNGKKYAVQKYQGIHKDEYTVMEMKNNVPNGTAQLFRKGLIQLSWKMVDGKREGNLTVYDEKGVVFGITTWESLQEAMTTGINRVIVNDRSGKRLLVERCIQNGVITYKGGYHKFTMHKEGYGIEYYLESGYEKSVGFYRDDKLIHIYQSFEKNKDGEWLMTEYDGDENMNNVDEVLNCHPIYVGKYRFDEKRLIFIRSGCGYKINICTGICDCLVDYDENGDEVEESQTELFGGWYSEGKCNLSIRVSELERVEREEMPFWNEIINVCPGLKLSYTRGIEELVIEDYQKNDGCSDNSDMKLNVSGFVRLNKIVIGKMCFKNVREFVLEGLMSLEKVVVGEKCFRISEYEREDGLLRISNCPNLCHLEIGDRSFEDYKQFELSNVNSLHTIQFGEQCFRHIEDFILKGK